MKLALPWQRGHRGAAIAPQADDLIAQHAERLFWAWAAMMGAALFTAWWLRERGAWTALVAGDPTGISVGITVLSVVVSLWVGWRLRLIAAQALPRSLWREAWKSERAQLTDLATQTLAERTHGPHETAWWFCGATIKLGLLGTVVGFIVMSSQIGEMPSLDFDQVQVLLKRMTQGMAIALYTTLVGLIANLWLGLQLMLLDRIADRLAADILAQEPH
jgi:MotA/TolQ/ExbB proton channel family